MDDDKEQLRSVDVGLVGLGDGQIDKVHWSDLWRDEDVNLMGLSGVMPRLGLPTC